MLMAQVSMLCFGVQFSHVIKCICDHQCHPPILPSGVPVHTAFLERTSGFLPHQEPEKPPGLQQLEKFLAHIRKMFGPKIRNVLCC